MRGSWRNGKKRGAKMDKRAHSGVEELEEIWKWGLWKVGQEVRCYYPNCTVLRGTGTEA